MEDEQWSIVGKPRKQKTGEIKAEKAPIEDPILTYKAQQNSKPSMVKTSSNKENVQPKRKTQIPVKVKAAAVEKKKKTESPAGYRTLQAALNALNVGELKSLLEASKLQFNNDVIQLKTVVTFLNEKVKLDKTEDALIFDKALNYPDCILPSALKSILHDIVAKCSHESLQYFYHNLIQSLCEELNKSRNFIGILIMLQTLTLHYPAVALTNLASTVILRNSYQNQPTICCLMSWVAATSGYSDPTVGVRVWLELISPIVTAKSYTKFAFEILQKILNSSNRGVDIAIQEYKMIIEILLGSDLKTKQTKELLAIKKSCAELLTSKIAQGVQSEHAGELFGVVLKYSKRAPETFVNGILDCCIAHPEESLDVWSQKFNDYKKSNLFVFRYLENNLKEAEKVMKGQEFVLFMERINFEKHPDLRFVKDIPAKMTENKKQKKQKKTSNGSSGSCCRWFFGSIVLFGAIAGLITYDTNVLHGGKFEESSVGRVLKQAGVLPHVENAWFVSLKFSARGYKWVEEHAPVAYTKTRTFMQPYCDFTKDLALTGFNGAVKGWESTKVFVAEKTPVVIAFVDQYVPGVGQKVHDFTISAFKGISSVTSNAWRQSVDFFKTKVFVGQLSPENIGKAFNSTTQHALTYYSWFHEKVDFYAKVK